MAFSQNPFSVASFGESYEQADVIVTLTSVAATSSFNGANVVVTADADVTPSSVQATGSINDALSITGDALLTLSGAQGTGSIGAPTIIEGVGVTASLTGTSSTGNIGDPNVKAEAVADNLSGVSATGTVNSAVTIEAKAVVTPASATATGTINPPEISCDASFVIVGVEAEAITDDPDVIGDEVVVDADATATVQGLVSTFSIANVAITISADVELPSILGTLTLGQETVNTVQFDYQAVKDNYGRNRTVYIKELTDNTTRVVSVNEVPNNIVYVEAYPSEARTVYVLEPQNRTVYVEEQPSNFRTVYAQAA